MSANVVTIYCCGTGGHRDKHAKWAVPYLYSIDSSVEGDGKFICDGPGSARSIRKVENIMKSVESGGKVKMGAKHGSGKLAQMFKGATGKGTADNVVLCMQWLWHQVYLGQSGKLGACAAEEDCARRDQFRCDCAIVGGA